MSAVPGSNPFATRYTRPGAVEYLFPPGESADTLAAKLAKQHWWGAIIGPHGAGKSTLLHTLEPALEVAGRQPVLHTLHQDQRTLSIDRSTAAAWNASTQVIVDGYEQLSWWGRWRLKSLCRKRGTGLLVTAHAPVDLPVFYRVEPSLETAQQVVETLLDRSLDPVSVRPGRNMAEPAQPNQPGVGSVISRDDVAAAFARQHGNVREALFELHDLYRRRTAAS